MSNDFENSSTATFHPKTVPSFKNERYDTLEIKEAKGGIYYRVDDLNEFEPKKWKSSGEEGPGRWFGFEKPKTQLEAQQVYGLNPKENSAQYLHTFHFDIGNCTKKDHRHEIFVGIEKDTGHTIAKMHSDLVKHAVQIGISVKLS